MLNEVQVHKTVTGSQNEQSRTGSILFLYQTFCWCSHWPMTEHCWFKIVQHANLKQKMKSPNWCTHPGFCRIPQPSKWEIDLRSSLYKPVGVSGTCAKTHNKFIKPPSTLYPETTGKIWGQHKFSFFFFLARPPQVKDQMYPLLLTQI